MNIAKRFINSFITAFLVFLQVHFVFAQTAILPPAETTFFDSNGNPLTSGTIDFYNPGTTVRATTWQDPNQVIPNTNPVILDAAGRALIWGSGTYRQVVKDSLGNQIWDQITSSGAGSGGATNFGDGNAVGTIKAWAGITAPAQYLFAYGQQVSRTTYSALLASITLITSVTCTSGSSVLSSIADTSSISVGTKVEVSCISGTVTVNAVTNSTVTVSAPATLSTTVNATFFPFGNGNGSTTFTIPDLRGYVIAGRDNMGGTAANRLTSPYFGSTPDALGATGGSQNQTITLAEMASHNHAVVINDPGHVHDIDYGTAGGLSSGATAVTQIGTGIAIGDTQSATTGITATTNAVGGGVAVSASLNAQGGIAVSSTITAGGSGYGNSTTHVLTVTGGTCTTPPSFVVTTTSGGGVTELTSVNNPGNCTVAPPANSATTISPSGGTGATVTVALVGTGAVLSTIPNSGTGSGYSSTPQTLTLVGGTCSTQPQVSVSTSLGQLTSVLSVVTAGSCTQFPLNPVATTGGGGTGSTINMTWNDGGSGWTNGARVITVNGGTCTTQPQFNATMANGAISSIGSLVTAGNCSIPPVNPAAISDAGGVGASASIANGGSGYLTGSQILTVVGGTCSVPPSFNVTVSGNTVTTVNSVASAGSCTITPTNPVATTGGGGVGATLSVSYTIAGSGATANVVYSAQPIPTIQPTITLNYVIKVLPDASLSTTNVVTSINGQIGAFTCGANITCSGNVISATGGGSGSLIVGTTTISGGTSGRILFDNAGILGESTVTGTGSVVLASSPTLTTPTLGAATATSINGLSISSTTSGTLTIQNSVVFNPGANSLTFTTSGTTNITFPTSGTMVTSTVTTLSNLANVGTLVSGSTGAGFTLALGTSTLTGQVGVANGGTGLSSGTSGGVPYFNATNTIASSAALTANKPVIGGGAGVAPTVGTVQNTNNNVNFATITSAGWTNGHCVSIDSNLNLIDAGGACTTGGGGGTVSSGTANQLTYYASSGTVVAGLATCNSGVYITSGAGAPSCATTLPSGLSAPSLTVTSAFTATGLVTNSDLVNASTTVNGQTCTLGSTCTISTGNLTIGSTGISGGTTGRVLYDNSGTLGEYTITGTAGNVVMSTSPTISTPTFSGTVTGPSGTWTAASGLSVTGGGTGLIAGTSGGILYFNGTTSLASSAVLTANNPIFGGGAGTAPFTGTVSGNTTELATINNSLIPGNCIKSDTSGNLIDSGTTCGGSGAVLLATLSPSSIASINACASGCTAAVTFNSAYKSYDFVINSLTPASGSSVCSITIQSGGSFKSTGYLSRSVANGSSNTIATYIPCSDSANNNVNTATGVSGTFRLYNTTGMMPYIDGNTFYVTNAATADVITAGGAWYNGGTGGAVTGIQFQFTTQNIASGNIYIYGNP